ncbi:MCP four helix bundle domain-containing protein, partial [Rubrivivax sp. JA1024]|nr:MCP four helix bundle domain-containing protein [Rubrivivax sp. JA1024]
MKRVTRHRKTPYSVYGNNPISLARTDLFHQGATRPTTSHQESAMAQKSEMRVATRLIIGFAAVATLGVATALYSALQLRGLSSDIDTLASDRMSKVEKFSAVKDNMNAIARYARNIVIVADPAIEAAERKKIAEMRAE